MNWRDATHFDSEGDYRTGCRNVSHCQQQQSYSGLSSPGRSNSTYLWNEPWVQTFQRRTLRFKKGQRKCSCIRGQIMPTRNNNRKKIIMCVTTSQPEKSSKNHIKQLTTLQSIIYSPEEKFLGTSSIWYEVIVVCCLLSPFLHSEILAREIWERSPLIYISPVWQPKSNYLKRAKSGRKRVVKEMIKGSLSSPFFVFFRSAPLFASSPLS